MIGKRNFIMSIIAALLFGVCFIFHVQLVKKFDPEGKTLELRLTRLARSCPKL